MLSKQRPLSKVYLMFYPEQVQIKRKTVQYMLLKSSIFLSFLLYTETVSRQKKFVCHGNLSTWHPSFDFKQEGHVTKKYFVGKKVKQEKCIWNEDHYFII